MQSVKTYSSITEYKLRDSYRLYAHLLGPQGCQICGFNEWIFTYIKETKNHQVDATSFVKTWRIVLDVCG